MHRSRDHAIRGYNDYLEVTGHARIVDFNEFGYDASVTSIRHVFFYLI